MHVDREGSVARVATAMGGTVDVVEGGDGGATHPRDGRCGWRGGRGAGRYQKMMCVMV
jgi:hypothetical protein